MIDAQTIQNKLGRQGFIDFVARNQPGQKVGEIWHRKALGHYLKYKMCEHGVWVIQNYKAKVCKKCQKEPTKLPDFQPHFNLGLGCYIESRAELKRVAKEKGLTHIGSDKVWSMH